MAAQWSLNSIDAEEEDPAGYQMHKAGLNFIVTHIFKLNLFLWVTKH